MNTSEDIMANMRSAKYFTKLDLCKGYWLIPIQEADIENATFITLDGHSEFIEMPLGLINSARGNSHQRIKRLQRIEKTGVYGDDIIIYNDTCHEHLNIIETVLYNAMHSQLLRIDWILPNLY